MSLFFSILRNFRPLRLFRKIIPHSLVNTFWHLPLALAAVVYYRYPAKKLTVIGITGTDGKTTTATLTYHLLKTAKSKVALISTVSAKIGNQDIDTGFHITTPSSWKLQRLLRRIANQGITYVVLETTSHGLVQHRLLGCHFYTGVFTNLTHEHLDYHHNLDQYLHAKAKLFRRTKFAVLNADDSSFTQLQRIIKRKNPRCQIITYSLSKKSDIRAKNISQKPSSTNFSLHLNPKTKPPHWPKTTALTLNLQGSYNLSNTLAAVGAVLSLSFSPNHLNLTPRSLQQALSSIPPIPGRLELVSNKKGLNIIIDFAHTPNALEQVLTNITRHPDGHRGPLRDQDRANKSHRLITIFGCAGLRDPSKRPLMGVVSARLSDITILTAEDPRTEDVNQIISQIAQGCLKAGARLAVSRELPPKKSAHFFFRIPDRQQAISFAIQQLAQPGDTILIAGKGHEKSMCFGTTETPWSDREAVHKALN